MQDLGMIWLLAAIDGHAKNFSTFLTPGGYRLTPLYDVMSAALYPQFLAQKAKLAMSFGDRGYSRISQIQLRHFNQTGQKAGMHEQDMESIFSELVVRIPRRDIPADSGAKARRCELALRAVRIERTT